MCFHRCVRTGLGWRSHPDTSIGHRPTFRRTTSHAAHIHMWFVYWHFVPLVNAREGGIRHSSGGQEIRLPAIAAMCTRISILFSILTCLHHLWPSTRTQILNDEVCTSRDSGTRLVTFRGRQLLGRPFVRLGRKARRTGNFSVYKSQPFFPFTAPVALELARSSHGQSRRT